jgi:hypothetical protein
MSFPRKVPFRFAYEVLNQIDRGYDDDDKPEVTIEELVKDAEPWGELIAFGKLKKYFRTGADFLNFKNRAIRHIPDEYWTDLISIGLPVTKRYARKYSSGSSSSGVGSGNSSSSDSRSSPIRHVPRSRDNSPIRRVSRSRDNSPIRRVSRSRDNSPIRRVREPKKLKVKAYRRGHRGSKRDEGPETSRIRIGPAAKGCDKKDVNFPKPLCKTIRAVCPQYDARRRYTKIDPDGSEDDVYDFDVTYTRT